ncbi:MAG TPA: methylated-DNA--[protein]-cysteine S-methyltransferase [Longimicrobiales bacterium]|nr:methylated-DNA--[protein]-cysteine S-methyltransferase [Longimicrobiales bacterium]
MLAKDYQRVAEAIRFLETHAKEQPALAEVAAAVGLSEFHFQRLFKAWAGTTPKRFLQMLTLADAKRRLEASRPVLHASFEAGLSGPGRLHDLFVTIEGVTPGEYRDGGPAEIRRGFADTPFGECLIGLTTRGVCHLSFTDGDRDAAVADLATAWPGARLVDDDAGAAGVAHRIFGHADNPRLVLHVRGTNFQLQVWRALLRIPEGALAAYDDVAHALGRPRSVRAVAGAIARNNVGYLIPCHRVIRKTGALTGYRWGAVRKQAILAWEAARSQR